MASGAAQLDEFDPFAKQPKMSYKDGFQKRSAADPGLRLEHHSGCGLWASTLGLGTDLMTVTGLWLVHQSGCGRCWDAGW